MSSVFEVGGIEDIEDFCKELGGTFYTKGDRGLCVFPKSQYEVEYDVFIEDNTVELRKWEIFGPRGGDFRTERYTLHFLYPLERVTVVTEGKPSKKYEQINDINTAYTTPKRVKINTVLLGGFEYTPNSITFLSEEDIEDILTENWR